MIENKQNRQRDWTLGDLIRATSVADRALIRVLAFAHQRHWNPSSLVAALALEFDGQYKLKLQQLASLLASGIAAVDALERVPGVLNPNNVTALRLAAESQSLPEMYAAMLLADQADDGSKIGEQYNPISELLRVIQKFFVVWLLITFLLLFIVPTIETMLDEFGMVKPSALVRLIELGSIMPLLFLLGMGAMAFLLVVRARDIESWWHNIWRSGTYGRRFVPSSTSFRSLVAISLQPGRPIAASLASLARCYPPSSIRHRLTHACTKMDQGTAPWKSLADERLLSSTEANSLALTSSADTQAWLLRWTSSVRQQRRELWSDLLGRTISIACTLALGIVVIIAAFAIFIVLSALIAGLS